MIAAPQSRHRAALRALLMALLIAVIPVTYACMSDRPTAPGSPLLSVAQLYTLSSPVYVAEVTATPGDACWTLYAGPNGSGEITWDCGDRVIDPPELVGSALAWAYGSPWDFSEIQLWYFEEEPEEEEGCEPTSTESRVTNGGGRLGAPGRPLFECVGETTTCGPGDYMSDDGLNNCLPCDGTVPQCWLRLTNGDSALIKAVIHDSLRKSFTSIADTTERRVCQEVFTLLDSAWSQKRIFRGDTSVADPDSAHDGFTDVELARFHIDGDFLTHHDTLLFDPQVSAQTKKDIRRAVLSLLLHEAAHLWSDSSGNMHPPHTGGPPYQTPPWKYFEESFTTGTSGCMKPG